MEEASGAVWFPGEAVGEATGLVPAPACGEVGGLWVGISRAVGWGSGGPGGRAGSFRFVEDSKRVTEKGGDLLERGGLESDPDAWLAIAPLELLLRLFRW